MPAGSATSVQTVHRQQADSVQTVSTQQTDNPGTRREGHVGGDQGNGNRQAAGKDVQAVVVLLWLEPMFFVRF